MSTDCIYTQHQGSKASILQRLAFFIVQLSHPYMTTGETMWELDYKESWVQKNWCFWTVVLEETLESPLDCKKIQPVHSKGDQSWVFIGRTDVEAETPMLWAPDRRADSFEKTLTLGKIEGRRRRGRQRMRWHHRLNGHEFGQTPGVGDEQGGLECCSSWDHKESDTTEQLNWTDTLLYVFVKYQLLFINMYVKVCLYMYIYFWKYIFGSINRTPILWRE